MSTTKPRPRIDTVSKGFWDAARAGTLTVQRCDDCGHNHYPGTPVCPNCLSSKQSWAPVSGRGTLLSWVRFHRAYWDEFRDELPYAVILVGLEEGPLMISNLMGAEPESLKIGDPLEVCFDAVDEATTLPKFRPAGSSR
jgi:uncharacterized OB-fold protein